VPAEDFGAVALRGAAELLHLEEPILALQPALGPHGVVDRLRVDVRDAAGVAVDVDDVLAFEFGPAVNLGEDRRSEEKKNHRDTENTEKTPSLGSPPSPPWGCGGN